MAFGNTKLRRPAKVKIPDNVSEIKSANELLLCDPRSVLRLIEVLRQQGAAGSPALTECVSTFPMLEWFYYSFDRPEIKLSADGRRFHILDLMHEGMHQCFCKKFGTEIEGRPMTTLLNECLGIGLDLYFSALCFNLLGMNSTIARAHLEVLGHNSARLRRPAFAVFEKALKDPFKAYQAAVSDFFKIQQLIYKSLSLDLSGRTDRQAELEAKLNKRPYYPLLNRVSNIKPALFVRANCGARSNLNDERVAKRAMSLLRSAKSMDGFIRSLTK